MDAGAPAMPPEKACTPRRLAHSLTAFCTPGLFRPTPMSLNPVPFGPGSGQFGAPLTRMHQANLTSVAWLGRCPELLMPDNSRWAAVRRDSHDRPPAEPSRLFRPSAPSGLTGISMTLLGVMTGSACPGSPCLRMHAAQSSSNSVGLPVGGADAELLPGRGTPAAVAQTGDMRGTGPSACGQPDRDRRGYGHRGYGHRDHAREASRPPVRPCHTNQARRTRREGSTRPCSPGRAVVR